MIICTSGMQLCHCRVLSVLHVADVTTCTQMSCDIFKWSSGPQKYNSFIDNTANILWHIYHHCDIVAGTKKLCDTSKQSSRHQKYNGVINNVADVTWCECQYSSKNRLAKQSHLNLRNAMTLWQCHQHHMMSTCGPWYRHWYQETHLACLNNQLDFRNAIVASKVLLASCYANISAMIPTLALASKSHMIPVDDCLVLMNDLVPLKVPHVSVSLIAALAPKVMWHV